MPVSMISLPMINAKQVCEGIKRGKWWAVAESNHGHEDFQSSALPTELTAH